MSIENGANQDDASPPDILAHEAEKTQSVAKTPAVLSYASVKSEHVNRQPGVAFQIIAGVLALPLIALFGMAIAYSVVFCHSVLDPPVAGYNPVSQNEWWIALWTGCGIGVASVVTCAIKLRLRALIPSMLIAAGLTITCPVTVVLVICGFGK